MFVVYCPAHGSQVLMFPDNIETLVNGPAGVDLHWRCGCGESGVKHLPGNRKIGGGDPGMRLQSNCS